jgi:hypothetical protein
MGVLAAVLLAGLLDAAAPHVRPEGAELRALIAETAVRSATFRQLVDRIERSDLIVYVRTQHFASGRLEGRIGFATRATGATGARILLVELACPRSDAALAATLAHELHHATEIAEAPWVRDTAALAAYYHRIGETAPPVEHGAAFETAAARDTAVRVARELAAVVRVTHDP